MAQWSLGRKASRDVRSGRPAIAILAGLYAALGFLALFVATVSGSPDSALAMPDVLATESARLLAADQASDPAAALMEREARLRPYDATVWCRLAAVRFARTGRIDAGVEQLLWRSYAASPIDIDAAAWRGAFVFDHWQQVSPRLRVSASQEVRTFAGIWETESAVARMLAAVRDPAGRFALRLTVQQSLAPDWSSLRKS
jgi:hypothetical protein